MPEIPAGRWPVIDNAEETFCPIASLHEGTETLFSNIKTRGFDLEATHLTAPEKLSTLLAVLALAVTLTVKAGAAIARARPVPLKKHSYQARSTFALGLDWLRKLMATPDQTRTALLLRRLCSPEPIRLSSNNRPIFAGV